MKSSGEDDSPFDIVITLLEHTSKLILLFNDRLYTTFTNDVRLQKLNNFDNWMHSSEVHKEMANYSSQVNYGLI